METAAVLTFTPWHFPTHPKLFRLYNPLSLPSHSYTYASSRQTQSGKMPLFSKPSTTTSTSITASNPANKHITTT